MQEILYLAFFRFSIVCASLRGVVLGGPMYALAAASSVKSGASWLLCKLPIERVICRPHVDNNVDELLPN